MSSVDASPDTRRRRRGSPSDNNRAIHVSPRIFVEIDIVILLGAAILFTGLLFGTISTRIGVPSLLVFLLVGMAAGESGPGGIEFDNLQLGYLVSNLAQIGRAHV